MRQAKQTDTLLLDSKTRMLHRERGTKQAIKQITNQDTSPGISKFKTIRTLNMEDSLRRTIRDNIRDMEKGELPPFSFFV